MSHDIPITHLKFPIKNPFDQDFLPITVHFSDNDITYTARLYWPPCDQSVSHSRANSPARHSSPFLPPTPTAFFPSIVSRKLPPREMAKMADEHQLKWTMSVFLFQNQALPALCPFINTAVLFRITDIYWTSDVQVRGSCQLLTVSCD